MHVFDFRIYYEDTDHSGLVYHANYLKYFERAREHVLGADELVRLYREDGLGFVVYKAELVYKEGARFGDVLQVRTRVVVESDYRAIFFQSVWKPDGAKPMVEGQIQLVCVNRDNKLVRLPKGVSALHSGAPSC
ncbi:MAG: YbgC/FadM family acyl-CoA thioesterase [Myxococcales bacterium]|nr:YbgC/FadM family acyl-CoA thioesterase [Myxococcales bacterium]